MRATTKTSQIVLNSLEGFSGVFSPSVATMLLSPARVARARVSTTIGGSGELRSSSHQSCSPVSSPPHKTPLSPPPDAPYDWRFCFVILQKRHYFKIIEWILSESNSVAGRGRPTMEWSTRLKIALGSAKGLAYLHEDCHPKIIHRDIKSSNILLDYKFVAKVADFGLAKFASDNNTHVSTRVMGTFGYLAPEYASSGKLTDKSDVFSFGVMLLELITGCRPVDQSQTYMDESMVDWARPLLTQALEDGNYDDALVDPKLGMNYNPDEMARMIACAAACVRHSARRRPRMSQVVRALEGDVSLDDLNNGVRPGHSRFYSSYGSSDYDSNQHKDMKFRKMAMTTEEFASSEYSAPTSEYGQIRSASSSEGQQTQEIEMGNKRGNYYGFGSNL
ncbi:hypothetical protein ZIOFF_005338 [Zingiber officinale]|uniref:non-specific serine/threonine protein kinase n=1 Tax=Zingiber officinale TaxID=94328 RepID=A0A8J5LRL8_ZINOF|nr:hypothetical protein ZIOFF_005338 [Zingiber officinale]